MPIAFSCPRCQKPYKVKDEMAGRRVVCQACKAPVRIPAQTAAVSQEADLLAIEALADEPPAEAAPPEMVEIECPQCLEPVRFNVSLAGKQAPCPACRRIVRVPVAKAGKPSDWRESNTRPSLAKQAEDPTLEGHWGNVTGTSIVSRDALLEADVIIPRQALTPLRTKVTRAVIAICLIVLGGVGFLLWKNRKADVVRDDYVKKGLDLLEAKGQGAPPVLAAALTRLGAAEYSLRSRTPNPKEAQRQVTVARSLVAAAPPGTDGGLERLLVLSEVAVAVADLSGTEQLEKDGARLTWKEVMTELRKTLEPLQGTDPTMLDGVVLLQERLNARLGLRGATNQPMIQSLPGLMYSPQEQPQGQAVLGLGLLALKQDEPARAIADQVVQQERAAGQRRNARVGALAIVATQSKTDLRPPGAGEPPIAARLAYAEGFARQGQLDQARQAADAPGPFEHRFQARVMVAAAVAEKDVSSKEIASAVDLLTAELGTRDLPDWPLVRLGQLCSASSSDAGKSLADFLIKLSPPSPRAQAVRAWVLGDLSRSAPAASVLTESVLKDLPTTAAGTAIAWETLARTNVAKRIVTDPASVIENWPATARAPAYVGTALGLLD